MGISIIRGAVALVIKTAVDSTDSIIRTKKSYL